MSKNQTNPSKNLNKNSQSGFTFIEMLIAVAIFVVVATVSAGSFVTANRSFRKTRVIRDIHQPARVIFHQLVEDLRNASGVVCMNTNDCEVVTFNDDPRRATNHFKLCLPEGKQREYYFSSGNPSKIITREDGQTFNLVPDTTNVVPKFLVGPRAFLFQITPTNSPNANPCLSPDPTMATTQPFVEIWADFIHTNAAEWPPEFTSSMSLKTTVSLRNWTKIYAR